MEANSNYNTAETGQMTFVWNIYNLYMSASSYGKPIKSPIFSLLSSCKSKYHFELYPKGKSEDEKNTYVSLYLIKSKEDKLNKVKYKCSATVSELSPRAEVQDCGLTNLKLTKRKNGAFLIPNLELPEGDVTLRFDISYEKENNVLNSSFEDTDGLSSDISKVYDDKLHYDTVFYSRDTPFYIHRALLDVRFPKLAEQVSKNKNNIITISPRIETAVTECLLRYIYSGKLNRQNIPVGIYDAITFYELSELKPMLLGEPSSIFASTSFKKFSFTLQWRIQNFSKLKSDEIINYFFFQDNTPPWTWFKISFCFSKESSGVNEDIIFSLERYSCICKTIRCRIKISDLNTTFRHSFYNENLWKMPPFINKNAILENKSKYLSNDELCINLEIFVSDGTFNSEIYKTDFVPYFESHIPQRNLDLKYFQDLQKLFNNSKFSDVTIVNGEENIHGHKFILSARSAVFCRMLKENKDKPIYISDIDDAVVKSMLKFMYCGELENIMTDVNYAIRLYSAAKKYEIFSLQSKCARFLKTGLSSENSVDILIAADTCDDQDLKQHVTEFICSNPHPIMTSKEWVNIKEKKDLVFSLLEKALTFIAKSK